MRDRAPLWWVAAAVHAASVAVNLSAYASTGIGACVGLASMSVVLGAYSTKRARAA